MLHWLEVDSSGIVREGGGLEANSTVIGNPFTGRAIETFEQSPTNPVSLGKKASDMEKAPNFSTMVEKEQLLNILMV